MGRQVADELLNLQVRQHNAGTQQLARRARQWTAPLLDEPETIVDDEDRKLTQILHDLISGGKTEEKYKHWGEAASIVAAARASGIFLSEDHDARIAAQSHLKIRALSLHRLLHYFIIRGHISAETAENYVLAMANRGRGGIYSAMELKAGDPQVFGCVWEP